MENISELTLSIKKGVTKYRDQLAKTKKLFVRERIDSLLDRGSFVEDGLFANCQATDLPADGVITGLGRVGNKSIAIMANDSTVKAGSWGARTVEKILRIQETAERLRIPLLYLIDSAGARITDQVEMFPGRRGAGRIFYHQANLSGRIPQVCILFGPSAAGGAYIPSFCDVVIMVEGNASMYLGSPRMAEAVIGEKVTLEEMGGARMHCSVSGCGDFLVSDEPTAISLAKNYLSYCSDDDDSQIWKKQSGQDLKSVVPTSPSRAYDIRKVIDHIVDAESMLEIKALYAKEILTIFARIEGKRIGIIANQPMVKGGVLFVESAEKAARFIQLCDCNGIPLLFIADVPGFMVGSQVERSGIIRAGAKMIYAVSRCTVPKVTLIVRKAYGAGLYAMSGPAFQTDCVLALPTAQIAVMGPEPAINVVYFHKLETLSFDEKKHFVAEKIREYEADIDLKRLASEMIVDHIVDFGEVREEIAKRLNYYRASLAKRKPDVNGILPM